MDALPIFLSKDIEIKDFSKEHYLVINNRYNHYLKISSDTYNLLQILDGKKTLSEIRNEYNILYSKTISEMEVKDLMDELAVYGVFNDVPPTILKKNTPTYLKMAFTIFNQNIVNTLTEGLSWLFSKKLLVVLAILSIVIIVMFWIKLSHLGFRELPSTKLTALFYFIFMIALSLFHELGHAAAAKHYKAKTGKIGMGFYLLSPTFFADVSDIWRLTKKQRVVVNFGGIYFELIFTAIFILFLTVFPNDTLLVIPISFSALCIYNLNPFLRTDGYWVLSDMANFPNLQKRAAGSLRDAFVSVKKGEMFSLDKSNLFLMIYGIISYGWILTFLFVMIVFDYQIFFTFHTDLIDVFQKLFNEGVLQMEKLFNCMMTLITAYLIFIYARVFYKWFRSKKQIKPE